MRIHLETQKKNLTKIKGGVISILLILEHLKLQKCLNFLKILKISIILLTSHVEFNSLSTKFRSII